MRIFGWSRKTGGVSWYRIREPLRGLKLLGHHTAYGPELNVADALTYDVIVTSVHGEKEGSEGWEMLARLPGRPLMVYDIDDDVWNFRDGLQQSEYWQDEELLRNVQSCIACADVVTTPSVTLADIVSELNPNVVVLPNYVPAYLLKMGDVSCRPQDFTVGYQGGDTHRYDIAHIGPQLMRFLGLNPTARMSVWGSKRYEGPFESRVMTYAWNRSVRSYYASLAMSVGLAPLERIPFNDAKSAIKAVEYAALGIPCVATDSVTYGGTVIDGKTGVLVKRNQWYDVLQWLHDNPLMLRVMAHGARLRAEDWTTEGNSWRWEKAYYG